MNANQITPTSIDRNVIVQLIADGRTKVLGTRRDPYRSVASPRRQMRRDAKRIFRWFAQQPRRSQAAQQAFKQIIAIARGPKA